MSNPISLLIGKITTKSPNHWKLVCTSFVSSPKVIGDRTSIVHFPSVKIAVIMFRKKKKIVRFAVKDQNWSIVVSLKNHFNRRSWIHSSLETTYFWKILRMCLKICIMFVCWNVPNFILSCLFIFFYSNLIYY